MPLSPLETELHALLEYKKSQVDLLINGVRLERVAGHPIADLISQVCVARMALADQCLITATKLRAMRPASHRSSISRAYYSMYHAARTVSYKVHGGDDHQDHNKLHLAIPNDFPDHERWKNELKTARLKRNEADYDAYPQLEGEFANTSFERLVASGQFYMLCRDYLRARGCPI